MHGTELNKKNGVYSRRTSDFGFPFRKKSDFAFPGRKESEFMPSSRKQSDFWPSMRKESDINEILGHEQTHKTHQIPQEPASNNQPVRGKELHNLRSAEKEPENNEEEDSFESSFNSEEESEEAPGYKKLKTT
jgi:hypothetical protein